MSLVEFINVILKWKWLVLPAVFVVTVLSVLRAAQSPTSYSAETVVAVGLSHITSSSPEGISMIQSGERVGATYAELVTARPVMEKTLQDMGLDWQTDTLRRRISVSTTKNAPIIKIAVTDNNPDRVATLANGVSEAFVEYIKGTSKLGLEESKTFLTNEIAAVENEIVRVQGSDPRANEGMIRSLQSKRESLLREYQDLLDEQISSGDVVITSPAESYMVLRTSKTQWGIIGFVTGIIAGVVMSFIAEAVVRAVRSPGEGVS